MARLVATKLLSLLTPRAFVGPLAPIQLREIPEPALPAPDWLVLRTRLCGLCGSDYKQVFLNGAHRQPDDRADLVPAGARPRGGRRASSASGPACARARVGERVVLNPWLSCAPRGLPPCEWCAARRARAVPELRARRARARHPPRQQRQATGGFAPLLPAHESQCIPIPDDVSDEAAVLADPFSVSLHAILHQPPRPAGTALVYGCGTLGLLAIAILRALHPRVRVLAVARFPHQARLARAARRRARAAAPARARA